MLRPLFSMVTRTSVQLAEHEGVGPTSAAYVNLPCLLIVPLAALFALVIHYIHSLLPQGPEVALQWVGVFFFSTIALSAGAYLAVQRRSANPRTLGLIVLTTLSMLLVSVYFYWVSFYVVFPADILLWSESDFVNDILKFRLRYPIYTNQGNNESFVYTFGAQLLTYMIAWLLGPAASIPLWRMIQVGYVLLATMVAVSCCRLLVGMSLPTGRLRNLNLWYALWWLGLFLVATNSITNAYVHNLHNDALALLISTVAYWLLLKHISTGNKWLLVFMAIVPAAGFLVKQSVAIWAPLYFAYFMFFGQPRSVVRLLTFGLATFGTFVAVVGGLLPSVGRAFHLLGFYRNGERSYISST